MTLESEYADLVSKQSKQEMIDALVREAGRKARNDYLREHPYNGWEEFSVKARYPKDCQIIMLMEAASKNERTRLEES